MKKYINKYQIIGLIGAIIAIISVFLPISGINLSGKHIHIIHINSYNGQVLLIALVLSTILLFVRNGKPVQRLTLIASLLIVAYDGLTIHFFLFDVSEYHVKVHPCVGFYVGIVGIVILTIGAFLEFRHLVRGN